MSQQGFSPIIFILGIVVVSGLIVGGSIAYKQLLISPQKAPNNLMQSDASINSQLPIKTTEASPSSKGWKTYTAKDGSYSFNYPPEWVPNDGYNLVEYINKDSKQEIKSELVSFFQDKVPKPDPNNEDKYTAEFQDSIRLSFSRSDLTPEAKTNLESYLKNKLGKRYISSKSITIDGLPALELHLNQCNLLNKNEGCIGLYLSKDVSYFSFVSHNIEPEVTQQIIQTLSTSN